MKTLDWYFDFISPYAYLQSAVLDRVAAQAAVRRRPVLFAGLLSHYGQLGPAEIPSKRDWTFRHVAWVAARHGIPLGLPALHPFNPLPLLRLSIVLGNTREAVDRLFAFVWRDGHVPGDVAAFTALLAEVGVDAAALDAPDVKDALRANGEAAIAADVFGVPTAVVHVDGQPADTFWGFDATEMLMACLNDAPFFESDAFAAARALPMGPARPGAVRR
jgi:2-hydroxychromene-2-carboxylate isomerase